jgi:hypothetical protein
MNSAFFSSVIQIKDLIGHLLYKSLPSNYTVISEKDSDDPVYLESTWKQKPS